MNKRINTTNNSPHREVGVRVTEGLNPHLAMGARGECVVLRRAFTLIELLVVVSIIALLIAILLPVLSSAKQAARAIQCASNLKQVGVALGAYQTENDFYFPHHPDWGNMLGKNGTGPNRLRYDGGHGSAGSGFTGETDSAGNALPVRPLNDYLESPEVARCPDDRGDTWSGFGTLTTNNYEEYGNSYLPQWRGDMFGTMHISGPADPNGTSTDTKPMRIDQNKVPKGATWSHASDAYSGALSKKLVMGDWNWHMNRPLSEPSTQWHVPGVVRKFNILFADGHAGIFDFGDEFEGMPHTTPFTPDESRGWW